MMYLRSYLRSPLGPSLARGPSRMIMRLITLALFLAAWLAVAPSGSRSALGQAHLSPRGTELPSSEYLLKAAYLFNFAKFTEWPRPVFPGPGASLRLCVLGHNPFGAALKALDGRTIKGRPIVTEKIRDAADSRDCHVVFISAFENRHRDEDLITTAGRRALTISDSPGFARAGGMIGLMTVNDRIRFEVNLVSAAKYGLKFDVRMLQLADAVYRETASYR